MVLLSKRNKIAIRLNGYQTNLSENNEKRLHKNKVVLSLCNLFLILNKQV